MILTDGTHLISDTSLDELHAFAQRIGLKRSWFQDHSRHPHYDILSGTRLKQALNLGATLVQPRDILARCVKS